MFINMKTDMDMDTEVVMDIDLAMDWDIDIGMSIVKNMRKSMNMNTNMMTGTVTSMNTNMHMNKYKVCELVHVHHTIAIDVHINSSQRCESAKAIMPTTKVLNCYKRLCSASASVLLMPTSDN
jgi:hypothetical protein